MKTEIFDKDQLPYFPIIEHDTRVLVLDNQRFKSFPPLPSELTSLSWKNSELNFGLLHNLQHLLALDISFTGLKSLLQLRDLKQLKSVKANSNHVTNFVGLKELGFLGELQLRNNPLSSFLGLGSDSLRVLMVQNTFIEEQYDIYTVIPAILRQVENVNGQLVGHEPYKEYLTLFCLLNDISPSAMKELAIRVREGQQLQEADVGIRFSLAFCAYREQASRQLPIDCSGSFSVPVGSAGGYIVFFAEGKYYILQEIEESPPFLKNVTIHGEQIVGHVLTAAFESNRKCEVLWCRADSSKEIMVSNECEYFLQESDTGCVLKCRVQLPGGICALAQTDIIQREPLDYTAALSNMSRNELVYIYENRSKKIRQLLIEWYEAASDGWRLAQSGGCCYQNSSNIVKVLAYSIEEGERRLVDSRTWELTDVPYYNRQPELRVEGDLAYNNELELSNDEPADWYVSRNLLEILAKVDYSLETLEYYIKCKSKYVLQENCVLVLVPAALNVFSEQLELRFDLAARQSAKYRVGALFQFVASRQGNYFAVSRGITYEKQPQFEQVRLLQTDVDELLVQTQLRKGSGGYYNEFWVYINNVEIEQELSPIIRISAILARYFAILEGDAALSSQEKLFFYRNIYVHVVAIPLSFCSGRGSSVQSAECELLHELPGEEKPVATLEPNDCPELQVVIAQLREKRKVLANLNIGQSELHLDAQKQLIIDVAALEQDSSDNAMLLKMNQSYVQQLRNHESIQIYNYQLMKQPFYDQIAGEDGLISNIDGELTVTGRVILAFNSGELQIDSKFLVIALRKRKPEEMQLNEYYAEELQFVESKLAAEQLTICTNKRQYQFQSQDLNAEIIIYAKSSKDSDYQLIKMKNRVQIEQEACINSVKLNTIRPIMQKELKVITECEHIQIYGSNTKQTSTLPDNWLMISQQNSIICRTKWLKVVLNDYLVVILPQTEGYEDIPEAEEQSMVEKEEEDLEKEVEKSEHDSVEEEMNEASEEKAEESTSND